MTRITGAKKSSHTTKHTEKQTVKSLALDWNNIFILNKIRDEMKETFPWRVLQVETAEADDIIGTLCHRFGRTLKADDDEPILILSGDKDFGQLQKYANVEQFSPITKKWIPYQQSRSLLA